MPEAGPRGAFAGASLLLFAASATATAAWCVAMADMGEIPMPGGWALSAAWLPMCGQSWAGAAASFVAMWAVMMIAMMLPSLVPVLWQYRRALGARGARNAGRLTTWAGAGYFFVWSVLGAIVFAVGAAFATAIMELPQVARGVPLSLGLVVLLAGAFQFTACKARLLARCRGAGADGCGYPARPGGAWCYGMRLGLQCSRACASFTALLLVIGVMDLRAMALIAAAVTAERLAPAGERVAWAVGAASIVAGVYLMGRAAWLA